MSGYVVSINVAFIEPMRDTPESAARVALNATTAWWERPDTDGRGVFAMLRPEVMVTRFLNKRTVDPTMVALAVDIDTARAS